MRLPIHAKLRRLRILRRAGGPQDLHDVFFWRVRIGLNGRVLRDADEVAIRERIAVALREIFGDVCTQG
jgi:hypothetical protein